MVNFISGVILLFERSIHPGDIIEVNELLGRVEEINLRATTIKTDNEIELVIPNQLFLTDTLKSYTRRSRRARFDFPIPISCEYNPEIVIKIISDAIRQDSNILISLTSTVEVDRLDQSIIYNLRVWTNEHLDVSTIRSNLYRRVLIALASYGIEPTTTGDITVIKGANISRTFEPKSAVPTTSSVEPPEKRILDSYRDEIASSTTSSSENKAHSQIELVETSFEKIKPYANEFVISFYQDLFRKNPKLRALFRKTNMNKTRLSTFLFKQPFSLNVVQPSYWG